MARRQDSGSGAGKAVRSSKPPQSPWSSRPKVPGRRRPWRRRLLIAAALTPALLLGLWIAVHRVSWLGPLLANTLRSVIGVQAVTDLEELAYGVQDRWNRLWRRGEKPQAYWTVPTGRARAAAPAATTETGCVIEPFAPPDVGPVHASWSAPGDGIWVPVDDPRHPEESPRMLKTLLHPDKRRSWSAVSVVAIDLRQVDLHMMAGTHEPKTSTREARSYERKALIPTAHQQLLLAAFNGGFRAEHGHYGMKIDGVTIVQARRLSCLIAKVGDDQLRIGDWEALKEQADGALWWRQTPGCMVDGGELHPGLRAEKNTYWGATLDGDTIIRRSALGLSPDRQVLYAAIGDHTTAKALAVAMKHAGAAHVAQLDVNWSYPKFLLYRPADGRSSGELVATALCEGFEFKEDDYIRRRSERDFFYLTRKPQPRVEALVCGDDGSTPPTQRVERTPADEAPPPAAPAPEVDRGA